ncbi:MAG: hypothetical protein ABIP93_16570 [Gemmatimonadaceae bacterium]
MPQSESVPRDDDSEIVRVSHDIAGRLRTRGVTVSDDESPDDIVRMLEGVEAFERAVQSRGGDLMVDEPPVRGAVQPDDPDFLLPKRADDESASLYLERLEAATRAVRGHRPG